MNRAARVSLIVAGTALGLVLLAFGASLVLNGSDVPRGTSVAGVDIGGQSETEAREDIQRTLGTRVDGPVRLVADGQVLELDTAQSGLLLDLEGTLDEATSSGPLDRVKGMFGATRDVAPRAEVDETRLRAAVADLAKRFDRPLRPGGVTFQGTTPVSVAPQGSRALDVDAVVDEVRADWLRRDSINVKVDVEAAAVTGAAVKAATATATAAVADELTLTSEDDELVVRPTEIASALAFVPAAAGALEAKVDGDALLKAMGGRVDAVRNAPVDATFEIKAGKPVLVPARVGRTISPAALSQAVLAAIVAPTRTAPLQLETAAPAISTADAQALGIREQIGTFTTRHPCCAPRVKNIQRIADLVDGDLVKPGETYSLNGRVGERTRAKGFVAAPQIQDGEFVDGVGGGISQFTTTMYNATFFAGMQDVSHTPHSYYISRYPEGREATITFPNPDLKWKNDSPHGVLVKTSYTGSSITVTLYGTKRYDEVLSLSSGRSNITSPRLQRKPAGPDCTSSSGRTGFSITITRVMKVDGREVKRTKASHRYLAEPRVVCVRAAAPAPPPAPPTAPAPVPTPG